MVLCRVQMPGPWDRLARCRGNSNKTNKAQLSDLLCPVRPPSKVTMAALPEYKCEGRRGLVATWLWGWMAPIPKPYSNETAPRMWAWCNVQQRIPRLPLLDDFTP
ncbi:hypothetical protein AVEN_109547-1 [Araneus ventricosus]|uniref:Uncharacterized protein n=1 Tax=Araneus ventricosus TaxID=182803 RepID=A0A4Y2UJS8_ARAVE|nr:hypothetical protein AVEN_109547-1 [Araneus ventricosus]